ncbi:hypothetical protein Q5752_003286 [Cryptotrichosporon argae]
MRPGLLLGLRSRRLPIHSRRSFLRRAQHNTSTSNNTPTVPVTNASDISHAHFLSSAAPESDFNPTQRPSAGVEKHGSAWEGKLSPTRSHLFKLVLPLPDERWPASAGAGAGGGGANATPPPTRPTAFLLHPSQPLSHLTRLIAGSLPATLRSAEITYLALTGDEADVDSHLRHADENATGASLSAPTSKQRGDVGPSVSAGAGEGGEGHGQGHGEAANDDGREEGGPLLSERKDTHGRWQEVSWSQSTDLSDFVKQSCTSEHFRIVIRPESAAAATGPRSDAPCNDKHADELVLTVSIPTFASRTVYLRKRLVALTHELDTMTRMKKDIDYKAHKSAQRLAVAALGGGVVYWGAVIRFTFFTDAGWDIMEPVTWATGFAALLCSAAFLVYHNREVSYSSLLDLSISARKRALYDKAGLDVERWAEMVSEAKHLRREVARIAADYDIEWRGELDVDEGDGGERHREEGGESSHTDGPRDAAEGRTERAKKGSGSERKDGWGVAAGPRENGAGEAGGDPRLSDAGGDASPASRRKAAASRGKIDVDATIDEAAALAAQSAGRRAREKDAERRGHVVDPERERRQSSATERGDGGGGGGDGGEGGGEREGDPERRGRERARRLAEEGTE